MTTSLAEAPSPVAPSAAVSIFANAELFALAMQQAELFAKSDLVPKQFQGNVANCAIALEMASRLGASPFAVIQNLDVIHGRPSWRSVFLMGLINSCGRFSPLEFRIEVTGKERTVELSQDYWEGPQGNRRKATKKVPYRYTPTKCIAFATSKLTKQIVEGPPVSYDMAIEEGWVAKDGSKWLTELRELMLRYRAASFFAKVHASDLMLGMQTAEENYDVGPEMRQAAGREVAGQPEIGKPDAKANPFAEEPPANVAPIEANAEVLPAREAMVQQIRDAAKAARVKIADAFAIFQQAGLCLTQAPADVTDAELFAITKRLDLLEPKEAPAPPAEKTEAQRKDEALASIEESLATGFDEPIPMAKFEAMLRRQKLLTATGTIRTLKVEPLENIAASVGSIVDTDAKDGGDA